MSHGRTGPGLSPSFLAVTHQAEHLTIIQSLPSPHGLELGGCLRDPGSLSSGPVDRPCLCLEQQRMLPKESAAHSPSPENPVREESGPSAHGSVATESASSLHTASPGPCVRTPPLTSLSLHACHLEDQPHPPEDPTEDS